MRPNLSKKQLSQISLSESCKAIILGSLLGDGSLKLYKPYKNARFWIRHSWIQKEYWDWKIARLSEINTKQSNQVQSPTGYSKQKKLLFQSAALEKLTQIYNITYKNNRLYIKRKWLNHMSTLSLAIWWLDDGSIIGNGKRGVFCTDAFSKKDHQLLQRYLHISWKINTKLGILNREYKGHTKQIYRLYLNNQALKKFLVLIMPYAPIPSMIYKYCILYKDPNLQERWISEMLVAFPDWETNIRESIQNRKLKLKYFRK